MKVMVHGACGHMGRILLDTLAKQRPAYETVPVDGAAAGAAYRLPGDYPGKADVLIDFSHHMATRVITDYAAATGTPLVIATTGQTPEELELIRAAAKRAPVFFASNFSLGIAVLARLAKQAARAFPEADIEIVETHHNRKVDVPSGTALTLANALSEARGGAPVRIGRHENGKRIPGEIDVLSLRMGNIPGIHEIHICTETQQLVLKHEVYDRALFAEGAVAAMEFLAGKPAGLYGMEDLLEE